MRSMQQRFSGKRKAFAIVPVTIFTHAFIISIHRLYNVTHTDTEYWQIFNFLQIQTIVVGNDWNFTLQKLNVLGFSLQNVQKQNYFFIKNTRFAEQSMKTHFFSLFVQQLFWTERFFFLFSIFVHSAKPDRMLWNIKNNYHSSECRKCWWFYIHTSVSQALTQSKRGKKENVSRNVNIELLGSYKQIVRLNIGERYLHLTIKTISIRFKSLKENENSNDIQALLMSRLKTEYYIRRHLVHVVFFSSSFILSNKNKLKTWKTWIN